MSVSGTITFQLSVVHTSSLRNRLSDAHGKGKNAAKASPRHAELAVNPAGSMAMFLLTTWESQCGQELG
ncbi:abortive infection family protein [Pseudomonas entomophila]|uniref:abortive infection family protein n=1 Tax=Pseudomonas entomophila TaxID=312306 RepID=UPI002406931A|nr:abortive infection family protein [Pseudomonas entomophila]MDF9620567.1 abortive infection family protein [Pseudomonas entomophila]